MYNYYEERAARQREEIPTIKPRTLTIELSDADVKRLFEKAAYAGKTPGSLLESFIGDLVDGTYSNGSDERERAEAWFDRAGCGSPYAPTINLLQHLAREATLEDALDTWNEIQYLKMDLDDEDEDITDKEREQIAEELKDAEGSLKKLCGKYTAPEEWQKVLAWRSDLEKHLKGMEVSMHG